MLNRTADFFLTVLGTLLVIATFTSVLILPIYIGFSVLNAKPGDGAGGRIALGSAGFLVLAGGCATGAWALRRVLNRSERNATQAGRGQGFEVSPPAGPGARGE